MSTTNLLEQGTSYLIVDCELTEFTRRLWLFVDAYNAVSDRGEASKVVHFVPAIMLRFRRRSGRDRRRAGYPCVFLCVSRWQNIFDKIFFLISLRHKTEPDTSYIHYEYEALDSYSMNCLVIVLLNGVAFFICYLRSVSLQGSSFTKLHTYNVHSHKPSSWFQHECALTIAVSQESTRRFIIKRHELQHLFTGKRNTGKYGYQ
ncbi:unnamed protein product [Ixodes persulcatus]